MIYIFILNLKALKKQMQSRYNPSNREHIIGQNISTQAHCMDVMEWNNVCDHAFVECTKNKLKNWEVPKPVMGAINDSSKYK